MVSVFVSKIIALPRKMFACEFNNGLRYCLFDMSQYLDRPAFIRLTNDDIFASISCENGVPSWDGGRIDVAPEDVFETGRKISAEEYSRISYMASEIDRESLSEYLKSLKIA